jgi:hypothetical protein
VSEFIIRSVSGSGNVFGDGAQVRQTIGTPRGRVRAAEDAEPMCPGSGAEDAGRLRDEEITELASLYSSPGHAAALLQRAGFRTEHLPVFETSSNPYEYWCEVGRRIEHGLAARGRQRLLAAARADYPANPIFLRADI